MTKTGTVVSRSPSRTSLLIMVIPLVAGFVFGALAMYLFNRPAEDKQYTGKVTVLNDFGPSCFLDSHGKNHCGDFIYRLPRGDVQVGNEISARISTTKVAGGVVTLVFVVRPNIAPS